MFLVIQLWLNSMCVFWFLYPSIFDGIGRSRMLLLPFSGLQKYIYTLFWYWEFQGIRKICFSLVVVVYKNRVSVLLLQQANKNPRTTNTPSKRKIINIPNIGQMLYLQEIIGFFIPEKIWHFFIKSSPEQKSPSCTWNTYGTVWWIALSIFESEYSPIGELNCFLITWWTTKTVKRLF